MDKNNLLKALLGAGLYLLDPVRDRLAGRLDDVTDRAHDGFDEASARVGRAARAIRGEDSNTMASITALLIGVGIGVGVGMLIAPASGEETRSNLAGKVQDVSDRVRGKVEDVTDRVRGEAQEVGSKVRNQFSGSGEHQGTGTYGGV